MFVSVVACSYAKAQLSKLEADTLVRIEDVTPTGVSFAPVSLFGETTQDVLVSVSNAIVGTIATGHLLVLVNIDHCNGVDPKPGGDSNNWWAGQYVQVDVGGDDADSASSPFVWSSHAGEFYYRDVRIFRKFENGKFAGTYLVNTVVTLSEHASWTEDVEGASTTITLYKLKVDEGHGTGFGHDLYFQIVASAPASKVTGAPAELKSDFEALIRAN